MFPIRTVSYRAHFFASSINSASQKKGRGRGQLRQFSTVMTTQFTHDELRQYDGKGASGKIYVAVKGNVYDVTEKGKEFYGPGGPYEAFAGHDASRGLACMDMVVKSGPDDLSDLTPLQQQSLDSWQHQFDAKYHLVGTLK